MIPNPLTETHPAPHSWLLRTLRPSVALSVQEMRIFLLVGGIALFAGYAMNIYGLAMPQIQTSLQIPENRLGSTVSLLRLSVLVALPMAWFADVLGRQRLLLITMIGLGLSTLMSGLSWNYDSFVAFQFLTRVFGYTQEMLCFVVAVEVVPAAPRGWAITTLATLNYIGGGIAALIFGLISNIAGSWHLIFILGVLPIFCVVWLQHEIPETRQFCRRKSAVSLAQRYVRARKMLIRLPAEMRGRLISLMVASAAFGFALWPALVMGPKYLETSQGFSPLQSTALIIVGGGIAAWLNIIAGRISDRIGRRSVVILATLLALVGYGLFFSAWHGPLAALMWPLGFFGFLCGDGLLAGLATELFPTSCRATVSGLRYGCGVLAGAVSLALEGGLYDILGGQHGPAVQIVMLAAPVAVYAMLHLPEPAGRTLEKISGASEQA